MTYPPAPGIYVHVPFCRRKCGYCDFYSVCTLENRADYVTAVLREMVLTGRLSQAADTLYFGGGTPSLLSAFQVGRLIEKAAACLGLAADSEITLEVNPATVTLEDLKAFRAVGVNRLTIGVQSFKARHLTRLGRLHSVAQARQTIDLARRAGFDNIAIDLMYALPGQTLRDWQEDLRQAVAVQVDHISCYMLSLEPGTPMQAEVHAGRLELPSEAHAAALFRDAHARLSAAGFEHYEIANFARTGAHRSRHNQKYWNFVSYVGLGPSAHSYAPPRRWWNHRSLERCLSDIGDGRLPISGEEILTAEQQAIETIYLGLRQSDGLSADQLRVRHGIDFERVFGRVARAYVADGWIAHRGDRWCLTPEGMLFLDRVAARLIALLD